MYKVLLVAACLGGAEAFFNIKRKSNCPKVKVMKNFNTSEYIRASWYVQEQQENFYQDENSLYCVVATYEEENRSVPFFNKPAISVYNYAEVGQVNGPPLNSDQQVLCARQKNDDKPAKLSVAPCFLPNLFAGPYWVLAAGPSSDNYQWAIVSGGQPTEEYEDGCTTQVETINRSGLWIFSRQPVLDAAYLQEAKDILVDKGYTLSLLKPVQQAGCTYDQAKIKPDTRL